MRIALVTANLEPGRDGIGDHCRALAAALTAAGASPRLLALADRGVAVATADEADTLRLPAALDWSARLAAGRDFLAGSAGVSLQLAPYLYHPKGLLGAATAPLVALLQGHRRQVTLHETWVGWYRTHRLGDRLVGWRQRRDLVALLRRLAPVALDTSLPIYARQLARQGLTAQVRPVFGNLPAAPTPPAAWLERRLRDAGIGPSRALLVGTFGSFWPGWDPRDSLARLQAMASAAGRRLVLLLIGHHGATAARLAAWQDPGRTLLATGPLAASDAAAALNAVSGVLAVTPYDLAGKSSALATCLEFGLPALTTWGAAPGPAPVAPAFQALVLPPGADPAPLLARRPGSGPFRPQAAARAALLLDSLRG